MTPAKTHYLFWLNGTLLHEINLVLGFVEGNFVYPQRLEDTQDPGLKEIPFHVSGLHPIAKMRATLDLRHFFTLI